MQKLATALLLTLLSRPLFAQSDNPIKGNFSPRHQTKQVAVTPPTVKAQIDPGSRIGGNLQQLYQEWQGAGVARGGTAVQLQSTFPDLVVSNEKQTVLVRITAKDVAALRPSLVARGFVVTSDQSKLHFIEGLLPLSQLAPGTAGISSLASQGMLGVRPIARPQNHAGKVQNQADFVLEASRVRNASPTGYDGTGVRIGVMSDSYNSLGTAAAGVAAGELPASVQVLQDATGATDEGRAMLELVHDIAPGAGLAFSSVYFGEADFAEQIRRLADPSIGNCKILVDDVSYFEEPMFQDGVIAQAVEEVTTQRGVAYFSSAGNSGSNSSEYTTPAFVAATPTSTGVLNFNPTGAVDTLQRFNIPAGQTFTMVLQWSDPFYTTNGVKTDLDMYLKRADGIVIASSVDNNIGNQTPSELLSYTNSGTATTFDLVIRRRGNTADPARLKYLSFSDHIATEYWTSSGTIVGHHAALNSMAVAATPSYDRLVPESYTSKGSPTILFDALGNPVAATTRPKPDFTSVDFVSTSFFYTATPDPKDGYYFAGTSAAAPNAAAVAALLWQARPSYTPAQLTAQLKATAQDISTAGVDDLTGAGLINAYRAIYGNPVAATPTLLESFDGLGLSPAWEIGGSGAARTLVRSDYNPASAPGQLVLDNIFPYYSVGRGTNEATLHLNLSSATTGGWVFTFRQKKFAGETDEQMPPTFTGTSATDGVAISVDGNTWYRLVDLTGTAATTAYQTVSVNLTQFAQAQGLTLTADTRIRFQRYGRGQVDSYASTRLGGRAFDDINVTGPTATLAPVPLFTSSVSADLICPGTAVQFQDASLYGATSYLWTFPGGTPSSSTISNPVVTYATPGTYAVTLQVTNANGTATRTVSNVINVTTAPPTASFTFRQRPICPGSSITFTNTSTLCPVSYQWSFQGGSPSSSTAPSPTVTYATAGTYTVTLTATNVNGSTTQTATVRVQATPLPYAENFATGIPSAWTVLNPDKNLTWTTANNITLKDGSKSIATRMPFGPYANVGQRDSLQTPFIDLRGQPQASLHFDVAYAGVGDNDYNDSLSVDVYAACTNTRLGRAYLKSWLTGLSTTTPLPTTLFVPTAASQWRQEDVNLSAYANQLVYLRFVAFNQFGNDLYLSNVRVDNIVLATKSAVAESTALQVYPNPVQGGATLTLQLPAVKGTATVQLMDAVGRNCWQGQVELNSTRSTNYTLTSVRSAGIYVLLCRTADGQLFSRRVVVQ
ncbi:PKD domain-containing protein [Hymenobacter sp. GOD-10R]|uniref:PKD domain-containing protein n=1 Tax=Hymenobacter sp. GOD-10R TaxID=3093922 RepID=UPI002D7762F2|nr:PKD domain-containing protein [Hymenobacter sp. GOD-10R]WRQ30560.1 PKD domain-containing protein [Hymenobacter sp. GOD-10R]